MAHADRQEPLDGLQGEPDDEEPDRAQFDDRDQDVDQQGADAVAGIQEKVSAHDPGDGAAGPDQRGLGRRIDGIVGQGRQDAGHDVEQQVLDVTEGIFDVVAEHPQEQHVADEVHQAAMDEHGREHRPPGRDRRSDVDSPGAYREQFEAPARREFGGYEAELQEEHEDRQTAPTEKEAEPAEGKLVQEYEGVEPDQDEVDDRDRAVTPPGVGDGEHG